MRFKNYDHLTTAFLTYLLQTFVTICQCLDNVKLYKYANIYKNICDGSRVMSIFTKNTFTGQKDAWQSLITILHTIVWIMLK